MRVLWIILLAAGLAGCDRPWLSSNPNRPSPESPPLSAPGPGEGASPGGDATAAPPPPALPSPQQSPTQDCTDLQTQAEMTACAGKSAEEADQQLNQVYQELKAALTDSQQDDRLVDAQLAWIEFRDKDCEFDGSRFSGGSLEPMTYSLCVARKTQQRTDELAKYLQQLQSESESESGIARAS